MSIIDGAKEVKSSISHNRVSHYLCMKYILSLWLYNLYLCGERAAKHALEWLDVRRYIRTVFVEKKKSGILHR